MHKEIDNLPISEVTSTHILKIMKNTILRIQSQSNHDTREAAANLNLRFIGLVMRYASVILHADNLPCM